MASQQRHLKELLKEDQEPFHLTNYIAHKKHPPLTNQQTLNLQLKKSRKNPIKQNASFPSHFCKNACFFSKFHVDSPDYLRKSPLLSPAAFGNKTPTRTMFLHVPAKTAALLLEAACRVQKNSSATKKIKPKNSGFGLLGSVFKRLTNRSRTRKIETGEPADDVIRWADSVKTTGRRSTASNRDEEIRVGLEVGLVGKSDLVEDQTGFSNGRLSSVWSEENKSFPSSSSSSSTCCSRSASGNLSEEDREDKIGSNATNVDQDLAFCLSPPFRFALQKSPSTGCRSPAFCSPAGSPSRRKFQEHVKYDEASVKFEDEEEEKEQCSPVSILDPPFGDDEDDGEEEAEFDMECSYAFVQRAKQHLLKKLRKFEKLAELDPVELEKRMLEEEEEDEDVEYEADNEEDEVDVQSNIEGYLLDIARNSGLVEDLVKPGMKRLLSDLIFQEENTESFGANYDSLIKRVCKRLDSWKEVDPNTIEMMVAMDLKGQNDVWNNPTEDISQTAKMLEYSIFTTLIEDFLNEVITI